MKFKFPNLLKPLGTIIHQNSQFYHPSEPFSFHHFSERHPVNTLMIPFRPFYQVDVEANFGDLNKTKKDANYKIGRTITTFIFLVLAAVFYIYQNVIGFPVIVVDVLTFFSKFFGSAFFNATYKDFAYANGKEKENLSNKCTAEGNPETQILVEPAASRNL